MVKELSISVREKGSCRCSLGQAMAEIEDEDEFEDDHD
jgi:hypothetical protein